MQYRKDRSGRDLSILGYGCMRFSRKGAAIDLDKAEREVLRAYEAGVNYFDTAYVYPGSETALGEILVRNGIREKVYIATKLPQYLIRKKDQIDRYFQEELSRLGTTYIDYYLMHMITDMAQWENLVSLGIKDWIREKKASGQVINVGFSFHGRTETFLRILEAYDWDFCQIQYNYLDEHSQAGLAGLKAAEARGIPVIIMEPLRGGKLVDMLPDKARKALISSPRGYTAAEWAFRWLWNQPGVTVVLSGMNSLQMVEENIKTADSALANSFTEEDLALIDTLREAILEKVKVGCTGCRYCMPCPAGVDIPGIFHSYNNMYTEKKSSARREFAQTVGLQADPGFASRCVKCGKCEQVCPQSIPIREALVEADRALRPLPYRLGLFMARKFMFRKK